jgi:transposase
MEACCGAHYLGRILAGQGHHVRLMPAQYVRPFKSHKNDYVDAEAIAEQCSGRACILLPLKSEAQLDDRRCTRCDRLSAVINQIRLSARARRHRGPAGATSNRHCRASGDEASNLPRLRQLLAGLREWRKRMAARGFD